MSNGEPPTQVKGLYNNGAVRFGPSTGAPTRLASQGRTLQGWEEKQPCSFSEYLGIRKTSWIEPQEVLNFFSKTTPALSYKSFVLEQDDYEIIQNLILED